MLRFESGPRVWMLLGMLLVFAALPLIAQAIDQPWYIGLFRRVLIFAIAAISLDLILGYGGMVSLGHAAFFGIGAYVVGILNYHAQRGGLFLGFIPGTTEVLVTWPLAVLGAALLALVIGAMSLRTSGIYFIMITLAFAQMVYFFFVSLRAYGGEDGLRFRADTTILGLIDTRDSVRFYYLIFAIFCVVLYLAHHLVNSRFGMVIQGCRENERRMRAIGFPTFRYKLACFTIAGGLAGLAGALYAVDESFVSPSIMHWTRSGDLIVMVVLGGMGTLIGPALGAAVFELLERVLPDYTENWKLIFGPVLILIVLFARSGLYGSLRAAGGSRGR